MVLTTDGERGPAGLSDLGPDLRLAIDEVADRVRREKVELLVPFSVRQQVDERPPSLAGAQGKEEARAVAPLTRLVDDELERRRRDEQVERNERRTRRLGDEERRLRGHEGRDRGARFEEEVAALFRLRGADVTTNRSEHDKEFDVWATYRVGASKLVEIVECKDIGPVEPSVVRELAGKVAQVRHRDPNGLYKGIVVSRHGFSRTAPTAAEESGIALRTLDDLTRDLVDLEAEARAIRESWSGREAEAFYVEPDVVLHGHARPGELIEARPLRQQVRRWLGDPSAPVFALLGDFGAGKTTFCQSLAAEMALAAKDDPSARIPVLIDLRQTRTTHASLDGLLRAHLDRRGIAAPAAALRQRSRAGHLLLVFDGFDEMLGYAEPVQFAENLRQIIGAAEGDAKVLLTCRTNFFRDRPEELDLIGRVPASVLHPETTPLWNLVSDEPGTQIGYLAPFRPEQIEAYVRRAAGDRADELLEAMARTHDLLDLGRVPYLLDLIVKSAPELVRFEGQPVTVASLYEVFAQQWFVRARSQLRLLQRHAERVVQELARRLWEAPDQGLHYDQIAELASSLTHEQPRYGRLERDQIDYEIRSALFLTRDAGGYFRFAHRSFHEFFLARGLRAGLLEGDATALDLRPVTKEVVEFLCGMADAASVVERAVTILHEQPVKRVSENALLLAHAAWRHYGHPPGTDGAQLAGAQLGGMDLTRANLRDADLRGSDLSWALLNDGDLRAADLTGASLHDAVLDGANLSGARLRSIAGHHVVGRAALLRDADVTDADLSFSRFVDANLTGAQGLDRADLYAASLARSIPAGLADGTGRYDDPSSAGELCVPVYRSAVLGLSFHPHRPDVLAAVTSGGTVQIHDLRAAEVVAELGHRGGVWAVALTPDGTRIVTGGDDGGDVRVWDLASGAPVRRGPHRPHRRRVVGGVDSGRHPDHHRGRPDGAVRVWDLASGAPVRRVRQGTPTTCINGGVDCRRHPHDQRRPRLQGAGVGHGQRGADRRPTASAAPSGRWRGRPTAPGWPAAATTARCGCGTRPPARDPAPRWPRRRGLSVAWSPDGTRLASGADDGVRVWDAATGAEIGAGRPHRRGRRWLVARRHPPGHRRRRRTVRVWDAATGAEIGAWPATRSGCRGRGVVARRHPARLRRRRQHGAGVGRGHGASCGPWRPHRRGSGGGVVARRHPPGHRRLRRHGAGVGRGHRRRAAGPGRPHAAGGVVAWSPDGTRLATGAEDSTVRVWDLATGAEVVAWHGHTAAGWAVAWSPDGARLARGGDDNTVRVWDAATGDELRPCPATTTR